MQGFGNVVETQKQFAKAERRLACSVHWKDGRRYFKPTGVQVTNHTYFRSACHGGQGAAQGSQANDEKSAYQGVIAALQKS